MRALSSLSLPLSLSLSPSRIMFIEFFYQFYSQVSRNCDTGSKSYEISVSGKVYLTTIIFKQSDTKSGPPRLSENRYHVKDHPGIYVLESLTQLSANHSSDNVDNILRTLYDSSFNPCITQYIDRRIRLQWPPATLKELFSLPRDFGRKPSLVWPDVIASQMFPMSTEFR